MSERRKTRKRKRIEYVIGIGFLICVFGMGIINLLLPSKKISEEENRGLQQKPELSVSAVTSGSYMDQYEKYQADQFMGRNLWRSLKVGFSRLAGSKESRSFQSARLLLGAIWISMRSIRPISLWEEICGAV